VLIWSGSWMFDLEDIQQVKRTYEDRLYLLSTERNIDDYRRVAEYVDGNAYYWASVRLDTFSSYQEKLTEMGKAVHEHGGLWVAPDPRGFEVRFVGGLSTVKQHAPISNQDQNYFFTGLSDDWEILLLVYHSYQTTALAYFDGINFRFPNGSVEHYPFHENQFSQQREDTFPLPARNIAVMPNSLSRLDMATLLTLGILLILGFLFHNQTVFVSKAHNPVKRNESNVSFGVQLLEPIKDTQLRNISFPIAKRLKMKPKTIRLYLSSKPGLITKPLPLTTTLFLSRLFSVYGVRTQVVVLDYPLENEAGDVLTESLLISTKGEPL
jgi:hypothetical protein